MEVVEPAKERSVLDHIRNTWEFANLAQYIFTFGRAIKIDENVAIEVWLLTSGPNTRRGTLTRTCPDLCFVGTRDGMPNTQLDSPTRDRFGPP